jgi:hypothetical protein
MVFPVSLGLEPDDIRLVVCLLYHALEMSLGWVSVLDENGAMIDESDWEVRTDQRLEIYGLYGRETAFFFYSPLGT